MKFALLSVLALYISLAVATNAGDALYRGCLQMISKYTFECDKKYAKLKNSRVSGCQCWSDEFVATYYDCISRAENGNTKRSLNSLVQACSAVRPNISQQVVLDTYKNATQGDYWIPIKNITDKKATLYSPVKFKQSQIDLAFRSWAASFYSGKYAGQLYGGILASYFGFVVIVGAIFNLFKKVAPGFVNSVTNNTVSVWFRQNLANPALFGFKHSTSLKAGPFNIINMSLPTRAQGWIVLGYLVMFVILMFIKYDVFEGNTRFPLIEPQLARAISDRTSIVSLTQLPLVILFAGRNNIMLFLTGWSFDTFNVYHRVTSRVMYICIMIHGISYTIYGVSSGSMGSEYALAYVRWGIVAAILAGCVIIMSYRGFRENHYEAFLWIHRVFIAVFLAGVWTHIKTLGYSEWVYCACAIWVFDHVIRITRILVSGPTAKADMQIRGHEFIKFKVSYSSIWKPRPGSYAFVSFLSPFKGFWESHPFSCYQSPVPGEEDTIFFCMRILNGKTKRMAKYLANKPDGRETVPVLIEGPYGQRFPLETADSIIFICGGIGFTGAYSYACKYRELGQKKRIVFYWITRYYHNLDIFKDELDFLAHEDNVDVQIYVTDECPDAIQNEKSLEDSKTTKVTDLSEKSSLSSSSSNSINYGVPNLEQLVQTNVRESQGTTSFMVCGPPGLNDSVRKIVTQNMDQGNGRVDLYVEAFNW